ncbi:hypothetical protein [uncultured Anaerovibrio sp.]|nr:hypothetical protein [uncultured Anaerovibrio sp.]
MELPEISSMGPSHTGHHEIQPGTIARFTRLQLKKAPTRGA